MTARSALDEARYISFSTLRRNGKWVDTPVWFVAVDDCYYLFTAGNSGKVKRLRNFPDCRAAPCTFKGKLTGRRRKGTAWLVQDEAEKRLAHRALLRKYGVQMLVTDIGAHLSGRFRKRQIIGFRFG